MKKRVAKDDSVFDDTGDVLNTPDYKPEADKQIGSGAHVKEEARLFDRISKVKREYVDPADLTHESLEIIDHEIRKIKALALDSEEPLTIAQSRQLAEYAKTTIAIAKEYRDNGLSEDDYRTIHPDLLYKRLREVAQNIAERRGLEELDDEDNTSEGG